MRETRDLAYHVDKMLLAKTRDFDFILSTAGNYENLLPQLNNVKRLRLSLLESGRCIKGFLWNSKYKMMTWIRDQ